jgi:hypothetical protein
MRTVANQLPSGFTIRMADTGAQKVQWRLGIFGSHRWRAISIESLFEASEGQLNTFTFLDPTDNLLMWSEDWTQAVWTPDPLLQVTGGMRTRWEAARDAADEHCANHATDHSEHKRTKFVRVLLQRVCTERVPATIQLVVTATGQVSLTAVTTGASWTRVTASGSLSVQQDGIGFGVQLPAGVQVDAFGAQVEAQPGRDCTSRPSTSAASIRARGFLPTYSQFTATAPNQHSCQIGLISSLN